MASVADAILRGDTDKTLLASGEAYLRAAMDAIADGNHERLAVIPFNAGFQWVIAPPPEKKAPTAVRADDAPTLQRPPDAPTLQKPPQ